MNKRSIKKIIVIILIIMIVAVNINCIFAAVTTPTLVTRLNTALKKILSYLEKLAVPAAGVAIASGVMIRKFSFGDEEKMIIGKRVIINAILGYAIILLIDLILKFIEAVV